MKEDITVNSNIYVKSIRAFQIRKANKEIKSRCNY